MPRRSYRRPIHRIGLAALATALVAATGCSSQDPVGLRVTLEESGSGTLAVSALTLPEITAIETQETEGVSWQNAARLMLTTGTFSDLDGIRFVDAEVDAAEFPSGAGTLRIEFPCGKDARWFRALHVGAAKGHAKFSMANFCEFYDAITDALLAGIAKTKAHAMAATVRVGRPLGAGIDGYALGSCNLG